MGNQESQVGHEGRRERHGDKQFMLKETAADERCCMNKGMWVCGNSLWLLLETEKVRQRAEQREGLFGASAWRGPLFILPF